ncbi:MAG: hypothetical protein JWM28_927, partial [Chitinophagaceae bacterium]|nr:hypothetical protein [Chitinophagaceae bacterium]
MENKQLHYLSEEKANQLLNAVKNPRHRLIIMLLLDCGLRAAECTNLKYSNFNFKDRTLHVKNVTKTNREFNRCIPIPGRLYRELGNFIHSKTGTDSIGSEAWLFPSKTDLGHLNRTTVNQLLNRAFKKLALANLEPHLLRHRFAVKQLSSGMPVHNIKNLLGQSDIRYMLKDKPIPVEELKKNVDKWSYLNSTLQRLLTKLFPKPRLSISPTSIDINLNAGGPVTFGRKEVVAQLNDLVSRKINCVIIGTIGVGKSHLLEAFEESVKDSETVKVLKLDDANELKSTLAQMLIYILKTDQQGVYEFLFPGYDHTKAVNTVSRGTILHIAKEIIKLTEKKYYTLLIDNVDQISLKSVKILDLFKDHFTIITTARAIPVARSSFIWNFEIIRLQPLKREFALQLIHKLSYGLEVNDFELYRNHIFEQTNGNPRAIAEIIERYRKEPVITNEVIRNIRHTGALPEYDCTFLVLLFLACVACLRYLNHEVQNASFRVLGGIALVFL